MDSRRSVPIRRSTYGLKRNRRDDEHVNRRDGMLGPEYLKLGQDLQDIDPNSADGLELGRTLASLDKLCK